MKYIKIMVLFIVSFFIVNVNAKEVQIYFYAEGGKTDTNNFKIVGDYVTYNDGTNYATYKDSDTIIKINSIKSKSFNLYKKGYSLVSGKEWYAVNGHNYKTYYFSNNSTYKVSDIISKLDLTKEEYPVVSLMANWKASSNVNSKLTINNSSKLKKIEVYDRVKLDVKNDNGETLTYKSSNPKVARATPLGRVIGVTKGTATITVTTSTGRSASAKVTVVPRSKNIVGIIYNINGGQLVKKNFIDTKSNGDVRIDTEEIPLKIDYGSSTDDSGLANYNNKDYLDIVRKGYVAKKGAEWNTKPDGSGKSYSQSKKYKASDFCDASKKNCVVKLYVNWKKDIKNKVHFINIEGDAILLESGGKYALIDTGVPRSYNVIKDYLKKVGVKELEFMVLSHNHSDHRGNAIKLSKDFTIKKVYLKHYLGHEFDNNPAEKDEFIAVYNNIVNTFSGKVVFVDSDPAFNETSNGSGSVMLGDMRVYFYNTAQRLQDKSGSETRAYYDYYKDSYFRNDDNYNSIVNLVDVNGKKLLLMADMESPEIINGLFKKRIIDNHKVLDVFKVAHHSLSNCVGYVPGKAVDKAKWSLPSGVKVNHYVTTNTINSKHNSWQDLEYEKHYAITDYYEEFTQKDSNGKTFKKYVNSCFYNLLGNDRKKAKAALCSSYYTRDSKDAVVFDYSDGLKITGVQGTASSRCK